jgi:hypothetical protein
MKIGARSLPTMAGLFFLSMLTTPALAQQRDCKNDSKSFYAMAQAVNERMNERQGKEVCDVLPWALTEVEKARDRFDRSPCPEATRNEVIRFAIDMIDDIYKMEHNMCGIK